MQTDPDAPRLGWPLHLVPEEYQWPPDERLIMVAIAAKIVAANAQPSAT